MCRWRKHQFFPSGSFKPSLQHRNTYQGLCQQLRGYLAEVRSKPAKATAGTDLRALWPVALRPRRETEERPTSACTGPGQSARSDALLFKRFESSVYAFQELSAGCSRFTSHFFKSIDGALSRRERSTSSSEATRSKRLTSWTPCARCNALRCKGLRHGYLRRHIAHDIELLKTVQNWSPSREKDAKLQTLKARLT
jgi:hypothetical protein